MGPGLHRHRAGAPLAPAPSRFRRSRGDRFSAPTPLYSLSFSVIFGDRRVGFPNRRPLAPRFEVDGAGSRLRYKGVERGLSIGLSFRLDSPVLISFRSCLSRPLPRSNHRCRGRISLRRISGIRNDRAGTRRGSRLSKAMARRGQLVEQEDLHRELALLFYGGRAPCRFRAPRQR